MLTGIFKISRIAFPLLLSFAVASPALEHPGLYFSKSDLPGLRKQARGAKAPQFEQLVHWAAAHLTENPPSPMGLEERNHESCFSVLTNFGLLYQLTGEDKYLQAGRLWLQALLDTPPDTSGDFVMGTFTGALANGYDLFYEGLDTAFRSRLKDKLIEVLELTNHGAATCWWSGLYTHHDFWIPTAFMGLAALCLKGEYAGADSIARFSEAELRRAMSLLGDQGYWPEGVADWVYGMLPALLFFDCLKRSGGYDFYENEWLRNTARARLMYWLPGDRFMNIGDSYPSGRYGVLGSVSAHLLMRLASRYRDPYAQWLALREAVVDSAAPPFNSLENPYSFGTRAPAFDRQRHGLARQFLWYDPSLRPAPPDSLPVDKLYPNWDTAIFRAGWKPDDPVLAFCGGHLLGRAGTAAWKEGLSALPGGLAHTHQNAGSIYLWADGRFPLRPPSFGGRDGRFHSTVMVNGHGQFFDADYTGKVTAYESQKGWAMARMDLSKAYPPDVALGEFTRTLVYLKPRTVLLLDNLRGEGDNYIRRYEWLLQTDPEGAEWTYRDNSLEALPADNPQGRPWLSGLVFPSYRYYFERQSLDQPDGRPRNRALSVTIIGRMPARIEIAALLHAPAPEEDTGWVHRVECIRADRATTLIVPDGPYCLIPTGPQGKPTRSVVFAEGDSVDIPGEVPERGLLLVIGLQPDKRYRLESQAGPAGASLRVVPDAAGELRSSRAGNLAVREE